MYRVMIVDDEPLILSGIASMIVWEDHDCTIIGKATNGKQAYEIFTEYHPDIVITDIKMPVMDGLELIKKCKDIDPEFSFIVLTNLEEFDIAKKAISLGATDYLVKFELTEDSLVTAVNKAKADYDKSYGNNLNSSSKYVLKAGQEKITKDFFEKLLSNNKDKPANYTNEELKIAEQFISPIILIIHFSHSNVEYTQDLEHVNFSKVMSLATNIIMEMSSRFFKQVCLLEGGNILLVVSLEGIETNSKEIITKFAEKLNISMKDYFEVNISIGASEKSDNLFDLPSHVTQANTALSYYYYTDKSSPVIFYSNRFNIIAHNHNFDINFLTKDLRKALSQNDTEKITDIFTQVIDLFKTYKPHQKQAISASINLYTFIHSYFKDNNITDDDFFTETINVVDYLNNLGSLKDILRYLQSFQIKLCDYLDERRETKIDKNIEIIKKYIDDHYNEKLTLSSIAEGFNMSSGYLSSLFKKETGNNITDYINYVKIEKAKELLDTNKYLMYEISELVGFDSPYYFSKVFKKYTGISPKDYTKRM